MAPAGLRRSDLPCDTNQKRSPSGSAAPGHPNGQLDSSVFVSYKYDSNVMGHTIYSDGSMLNRLCKGSMLICP